MADVKVTDRDREEADDIVGARGSDALAERMALALAERYAEGFAAGVAQERERWAAIVQQETGYQAGVAAERERLLIAGIDVNGAGEVRG